MTNQLHNQQHRTVDLRIPAIEKYAYCLCLHVKPTTIFIAVFKLIRALLFASILLNTEIAVNDQTNYGMPINLSERHNSTAIAADILRRIVMASVSAVGIYAVISGRAALLMPLYAVLLIDFFFTLPSFSNWDLDPSLTDSFSEYKNYPSINHAYTRYTIMLLSTITIIIKIYFLCVIWKCYRYLRLIELVTPLRLSEIYPHIHQNVPPYPIVRVLSSGDTSDIVSGHNMGPPPYDSIASNMKPPNYEEAMKSTNMSLTINPANLGSSQQQTIVGNSGNLNDAIQNVNSTQGINDTSQAPELADNVVVVVALNPDVVVPPNNSSTSPNLSSSASTETNLTITNNMSSSRRSLHRQGRKNSETKPANDVGYMSNKQMPTTTIESGSTKLTSDVHNDEAGDKSTMHESGCKSYESLR